MSLLTRRKQVLATRILLFCTLSVVLSAVGRAADSNWPGWRGPSANGHAMGKAIPTKWSDDNVKWRAAIEGFGQSSPVVWGDRIYLTTAREKGRIRAVVCLNRANGKVIWEKVAAEVAAPEKAHRMNNWASATCVTDGKRVVAFFGRGGLHCFAMNGDHMWSTNLGTFDGPWGTAASPIIVGDNVIQNCDADGKASIAAINKNTGKIVWRTDREPTRGWCTPLAVKIGKRTEIVLNGERGLHAYDAQDGSNLWFCKGGRGRGTPTVVPFEDMLIAVGGRSGDMIAVKPGGKGTVTESHGVWRTARRGGRDLPSPIVVGKWLCVVSLRPGIATSYDAKTGTMKSRVRLKGNVAASPVVSGGHVFFPTEEGIVYSLKVGEKIAIVGENEITTTDSEIFRASVTPVDGQALIRSNSALYCIE